jgi:hypothetical protein
MPVFKPLSVLDRLSIGYHCFHLAHECHSTASQSKHDGTKLFNKFMPQSMSADPEEVSPSPELAEKLLQAQLTEMMAAMTHMESIVSSSLDALNSRVDQLSARIDQLRPKPPT